MIMKHKPIFIAHDERYINTSEIHDHLELPEESFWYDGSISECHFEYGAGWKVDSRVGDPSYL